MNKKELVSAVVEVVSEDLKITKKDATVVVNAVFDVVTDELVAGNEVKIANFGKFSIREVDGRNGHNPATGESIYIDAYRTPKFKASSILKNAIKEA